MFFDVGNSKQSFERIEGEGLDHYIWYILQQHSPSFHGKTERVEISVPCLRRDYVDELI